MFSKHLQTACLLVGFTLLGCSDPVPKSSANLRAHDEAHETYIASIENGLLPRFIVRGEARPAWSIEDRMEFYGVPGASVAVIVDGELAWAKGYGVLDAEKEERVNTETLFQAASISKPVSSVGILRLVEQGILSLDLPVNDQLTSWQVPENEFTAQHPVTLRQLLSHRAGTTVHGFPGYATGVEMPSLVQVLQGSPPASTGSVVVNKIPGESYRYSGGGTTIAQLLVEDMMEESFATIMAKQVLEPAGMARSHFLHPINDANAARAHAGSDSSPVIGHSHSYPELAAAGLWTTASDLSNLGLQIVSALKGEATEFLTKEMTQQMLTQEWGGYGLGFSVIDAEEGPVFLHNGGNHGYTARWFTYADGRGGVAVLTNADSGSKFIKELLAAVGVAYGWSFDAAVEREVALLSEETMQRIAGTYYINPDDNNSGIQISIEEDQLWIDAGFFPKARFYPASETSFFITDGFEFEIELDDNGAPEVLVIEGEVRASR